MGETEPFNIIENLYYILNKNQSGCLKINAGEDFITQIYFEKGNPIHAQNPIEIGDEAIFSLLGVSQASASFSPGSSTGQETINPEKTFLLFQALGLTTPGQNLPLKAPFEIQESTIPSPPEGSQEVALPGPTGETQKSPDKPPVPRLNSKVQIFEKIIPEKFETLFDLLNFFPDEINFEWASEENPHFEHPEKDVLEQILNGKTFPAPSLKKFSNLPLLQTRGFLLDPYPNGRTARVVLELLWRERFSGFLTFTLKNIEAVCWFDSGKPFETGLAYKDKVLKGSSALRSLIELKISSKEAKGFLAFPVEEKLVQSYTSLVNGEVFQKEDQNPGNILPGLFDKFREEKLTGSFQLSNPGEEKGFIFLFKGKTLGSFYEERNILEEDPLKVYRILASPGSSLTVFTSPENA